MKPTSSEALASTRTLKRGVGRWALVALIFNTVVGAGILGLPSKVYAVAGTYSLVGLAAACVLVALVGLCLCELSSRYDVTGGPYVYVKDAFGDRPAFLVGWLLYASRILTAATHCVLLLTYAAAVVPAMADPFWRTIGAVTIIAAFTGLTLRGARQSAIANSLFGSLKLVGLGSLALAGLLAVGFSGAPVTGDVALGNMSEVVLLFIFALMGFESATIVAGEIENPQRNLPFGILGGTAAAAVLYGAITWACIALVPGLAETERPISDLANALFGRTAELIVAWGAVVMLMGSLAAGFFLNPRMLLALGTTDFLPSSIAAINSGWRTPHVAILISAALILFFALTGSFMTVLAMATSARLLGYVACCAAQIRLRGKPDVPPAGFLVPGGVLIPVLAGVASLVVLVLGAWKELPALLAIGAVGALTTVYRWKRDGSVPNP